MTLIDDEKAERERQRQAEEREEMELMQREAERREAVRQRALERERAEREAANAANANGQESEGDQAHQDGSNETPVRSGTSPTPPSPPEPVNAPPKMHGSASTLERTGLCVVCQDEEANIAIVDCGHMAMCRGCSDLIMSSSRECPLCRTRIVTEARLLRIFRT